jgi:hypothetical protein
MKKLPKMASRNYAHSRNAYQRYLNVSVQATEDHVYLLPAKYMNEFFRIEGKYGTYLRRKDPVAFNVGYHEWIARREHGKN